MTADSIFRHHDPTVHACQVLYICVCINAEHCCMASCGYCVAQAELSAALAERGLPKSGLKGELAQRLFDAIQTEGGRQDVMEAPTVPLAENSGYVPCLH